MNNCNIVCVFENKRIHGYGIKLMPSEFKKKKRNSLSISNFDDRPRMSSSLSPLSFMRFGSIRERMRGSQSLLCLELLLLKPCDDLLSSVVCILQTQKVITQNNKIKSENKELKG